MSHTKEVKEMENLLEIINVSKQFRSGLYLGTNFKAVDNVSFNLENGEILLLVGESGCGKTTLSNLILGILKPSSGFIKYKGKITSKFRRNEKRSFIREVQPIFQDPYSTFNPFVRIDYYFEEVCSNFGITRSKSEIEQKINEVLNQVKIDTEIKGKFVHQFSGGQIQRLSIARALLANPSLLIADEAVTMIDASLRVGILNILSDLNKLLNLAILFITHDLSVGYYMVELSERTKTVVMYRGTIVEEATGENLFLNPLHPYTRQLIESVPSVDPNKKWHSAMKHAVLELEEFNLKGCKYSKRCPFAMKICEEKEPNLFSVEHSRVRCWLYSDTVDKSIALNKLKKNQ
ncbi:MAG: ABC transporter ATP-binding protein [Nitrososphaeria archaeon]